MRGVAHCLVDGVARDSDIRIAVIYVHWLPAKTIQQIAAFIKMIAPHTTHRRLQCDSPQQLTIHRSNAPKFLLLICWIWHHRRYLCMLRLFIKQDMESGVVMKLSKRRSYQWCQDESNNHFTENERETARLTRHIENRNPVHVSCCGEVTRRSITQISKHLHANNDKHAWNLAVVAFWASARVVAHYSDSYIFQAGRRTWKRWPRIVTTWFCSEQCLLLVATVHQRQLWMKVEAMNPIRLQGLWRKSTTLTLPNPCLRKLVYIYAYTSLRVMDQKNGQPECCWSTGATGSETTTSAVSTVVLYFGAKCRLGVCTAEHIRMVDFGQNGGRSVDMNSGSFLAHKSETANKIAINQCISVCSVYRRRCRNCNILVTSMLQQHWSFDLKCWVKTYHMESEIVDSVRVRKSVMLCKHRMQGNIGILL